MPVSMPINTLKGNWQRLIKTDRLKRSSQVLSVVNSHVCIFGGEVQPRQPVDDKVDVLSLNAGEFASLPLHCETIKVLSYIHSGTQRNNHLTDEDTQTHETKSTESAPTPRVGTASAVLNDSLYIFSGRGGTDMAPIEEDGAVWSYSPTQHSWAKIEPSDSSAAVPPARSYHTCTSDGSQTLYIHAGCPASGRLSDLWAFDVEKKTWTELPSAPAPHRGGASIAFSNGKLYRMNGFDGSTEVGGSVDIFDIASKFWSTKSFKADGYDGPEARSVCALLPVRLGRKEKLLTLFGERDPSSLGHAGAGRMLGDVWVYDVSEEWWTKLDPNEGDDGRPVPRGWFDADVVKSETPMGNDSVVVHGGLGEDNERLDDVWLLKF